MPSRRRSRSSRKASVRSTVPQYPGHYLTVGNSNRESIRVSLQRRRFDLTDDVSVHTYRLASLVQMQLLATGRRTHARCGSWQLERGGPEELGAP